MSHEAFRRSDQLRGTRISDEMLRALPKTDLLFHLDGSLRIGTFMELATAVGMDVPASARATQARYFPVDRASCHEHFTGFFDHTTAVMQSHDALKQTAREAVEDAYVCGVWYLEVRFCPLRHQAAGLSLDDTVAAVLSGLEEARQATGVRSGVIITGLRTIGPEQSLRLAELAVRWQGRGVVAFDLAGTERDYPAKYHRQAFYHIMNHNLGSTIHAGEGFGPESIHQALHYCGANRIGHGTRLGEDPDLLQWVNDRRVPLELCLSSNVVTGVVPTAADHPLRHYMDMGLRVTLNTDNTLFARTDQFRELRLAVDTFDLSLLEVETLLLNGFKSSFLPQQVKSVLTSEVAARFSELRDMNGLDELEIA